MKYQQDIKNSKCEPTCDHLSTGKSERILTLSLVAVRGQDPEPSCRRSHNPLNSML